MVRNCYTCSQSDKAQKTCTVPLSPITLPEGPWQKFCLVIVGHWEDQLQEYKYAVVLIDYYPKWPEVVFATSVTADTMINFLTTVFAREGLPKEIITYDGSQFTA